MSRNGLTAVLAAALGCILGLALVTAVFTAPSARAAGFPNERWNVSYVDVRGTADAGLKNALNLGLNRANQTYFYGSRSASMRATVRGTDRVDVEIRGGGKVLARRSGLRFSGTGAAASRSIQNAALGWLDSLACTDGGCAFAQAGGGAAPTAVAQAQPAPAASQPAAPKPAAAAPAVARVQPLAPAATVPQAAQPSVTAPAVQTPVLAQPAPSPSLAAPKLDVARADPKPKRTVRPKAEPRTVRKAVKRKAPKKVKRSAPRVAKAEPKPKVAKAEPKAVEPKAPEVAAPAAPKVAAVAPDAGSVEPKAVVKTPDAAAPEAEAAAPKAPAGAVDDTVRLARGADAGGDRVVEIAPGAVIPQPRPGSIGAPAVVGGGDAGGAPDVPAADPVPDPPNEDAVDLAVAEPDAAVATPAAPAARGTLTPGNDLRVDGADGAVTPPEAGAEPVAEDAPVRQAAIDADADTPDVSASDDAAIVVPTPVARRTPPAPETDEPRLAAVTPEDAPRAGNAEADVATPSTPDAPEAGPEPASTDDADAGAAAATGDDDTSDPGPTAPAAPAAEDRLAVAAPPTDPVPLPRAADLTAPAADAGPDADGAAEAGAAEDAGDAGGADTPAAEDPAKNVETELAAVDPAAAGPTLANARWVGFTPAVYTGGDNSAGAWISGPFDRKERTGWITDTATGATTRVRFIWREGGQGGRTAQLSKTAADRLGLKPGDVANVAVYLPR